MTKPPAMPGPDFEAAWYRRRVPGGLVPGAERDSLPLPDGLRLVYDEDGIEMRFPVGLWSPSFGNVLGLGRGVVWVAVISVVVGGVATAAGPEHRVLFLISSAVLFGPFILLGALQRRFVAMRPEGVEVGWWPVRLLSRRLVVGEIRRLFVRLRETTGGDDQIPNGDLGQEADLWIVRPDGRHELLVGNLASAEHAEWLRGWLERQLGIEDSPMRAGSGGAEGS